MNFFSIVIPVHNAGKYLDKCLGSILNQDFCDYEIIAVDDASIDNSLEILKSYHDERLQVFHFEVNEGPSGARNFGLKKATGKYIWFVDADDEIESDSLEILHNILTRNETDIVFFNYRRITSKGAFPQLRFRSNYFDAEAYDMFRHVLIRHAYDRVNACWMQVYKREFIKDMVIPSTKIVGYEDTAFSINAYIKANTFLVINDILYRYYDRENSQTKIVKITLDYPVINYLENKKFALSIGRFDMCKNDLLALYMDYFLFGNNGELFGYLIKEFEDNELSYAHESIKKYLKSEGLKEMLSDAKDYPFGLIAKDIYELMIKEDEVGLYHYLGQLALRRSKESQNETKI